MSKRNQERILVSYKKRLKSLLSKLLFLIKDVKETEDWNVELNKSVKSLNHNWLKLCNKNKHLKELPYMFMKQTNILKAMLILESTYGAISSTEEITECLSSNPEDMAIEIIINDKYDL